MGKLRRALRLYVLSVIAIGLLSVVVALVAEPPRLHRHDLVLGILVSSLCGLTYLAPVKLATKRGIILDAAVEIVALLVLRPGEAAAFCAIGILLGNRYCMRRPWFNVLFNTAQVSFSLLIAAYIYRGLAPISLAEEGRNWLSITALAPAATARFLISTLAVCGAVAIQQRQSPFLHWFATYRSGFIAEMALALFGGAVATAVQASPWMILLAAAPVAVVRSMFQSAGRFDAGMDEILEKVAGLVEAEGVARPGHAARVAAVAHDIGIVRGFSATEMRNMELAARLHDIVAHQFPEPVSDDPVLLSDNQRAYLRGHSEDAATYVRHLLHLPAVADILLTHHEAYDGTGFPRGLAGADIPHEARALAVADAWVSLTTPSAYRAALTEAQALVILRAGAGTQWDPTFVQTLAGVVGVSERVQGAPSDVGRSTLQTVGMSM